MVVISNPASPYKPDKKFFDYARNVTWLLRPAASNKFLKTKPQAQPQQAAATAHDPDSSAQGTSELVSDAEETQLQQHTHYAPDNGPRALVLDPNALQEKCSLPYHNFEGRDYAYAPGTQVLLCSNTKSKAVPSGVYAYGVVCLAGPIEHGTHKQRMYFDPYVVLPTPIACAKAWGQGSVIIANNNEHQACFKKVKAAVERLLKSHSPCTLIGPQSTPNAALEEAEQNLATAQRDNTKLEVTLCF